ncbi:MAG: transposase [Clostridiales bacterium]|nr:transposase [Clostridiales bacterium]
MMAVKKTGIKLHTAVDVLGFPYAMFITTANISDIQGAILMFGNDGHYTGKFETLLCDGGYTGEDFAKAVFELTGATVQVAKRSELY